MQTRVINIPVEIPVELTDEQIDEIKVAAREFVLETYVD